MKQTDNLLRLRYAITCSYPKIEGDKPDYDDNDSDLSWYIDKELLYIELANIFGIFKNIYIFVEI